MPCSYCGSDTHLFAVTRDELRDCRNRLNKELIAAQVKIRALPEYAHHENCNTPYVCDCYATSGNEQLSAVRTALAIGGEYGS